MSLREVVTADEIVALNRWYRDVRETAAEVLDCGFDDAPEALGKLDALVALASEHRARIIRRARLDAERMAREEAREEMETGVPPVGVC